MHIAGLQKLSLLDFPGHSGCTLFTPGCNMRCPFCHNPSLVLGRGACGELPQEEFFAFLEKRRGLLDGVCISGGEPLLQPDLELFIRRIRRLGFKIKLDTNGTLPEKLCPLIRAGLLDYVAMDVKNCRARYAETAAWPQLDLAAVESSVELLKRGLVPYEFRSTLLPHFHGLKELQEMADWLRGAERWVWQNFRPSDELVGFADGDAGQTPAAELAAFSEAELLALREQMPEHGPPLFLKA